MLQRHLFSIFFFGKQREREEREREGGREGGRKGSKGRGQEGQEGQQWKRVLGLGVYAKQKRVRPKKNKKHHRNAL